MRVNARPVFVLAERGRQASEKRVPWDVEMETVEKGEIGDREELNSSRC
jgi:hypothetical protein